MYTYIKCQCYGCGILFSKTLSAYNKTEKRTQNHYCTSKCRRPRKSLQCQFCTKTFQLKHCYQKFCGRPCYFAYSKRKRPILISKICTECKVEKSLTDFKYEKRNRDGRMGRCRICQNRYQNEWKQRTTYHPCKICGTPVKNKQSVVCSGKCSIIHRGSRVMVKCHCCGKEFDRILSLVRRYNYCSHKCCYTPGPTHCAYKGYRSD